jgi:hypothetical protein
MSANKYLIPERSTLLQNKLRKLSESLELAASANTFQTEEGFLTEASKILREFYKDMSMPLLASAEQVHPNGLPIVDTVNENGVKLLNDLTILFAELENIEALTLHNFNFMVTESNRIRARSKVVSSKLGDYMLYSLNALKDILIFKDSFTDLSKTEINTALLNSDAAEINQDEGILTLPIDQDNSTTLIIKEVPIINANSNGEVGNNQELNAKFNGDISVILDNNADTWFEYEKVVERLASNQEPLILDLTINLGDEKIINNILVNPNNFGTKTAILIDVLETSTDGQTFISIKDEIPIAGFTTHDEENVFALAPSTSKLAGQGIYTFTPRKAKYVHLVLRQTEAYNIQTNAGTKLRYAIGLRDVTIKALRYKTTGEFVSTVFSTTNEIRKVFLDSNQNPSATSPLVKVQWFVSPDNGAKWHEIQPKSFDIESGQAVAVPEILNFNGPEEGAIQTSAPVYEVRLKAKLSREDSAFTSKSSTLAKSTLNANELHDVPSTSPFEVILEHLPIANTVSVIDPMYGSRGIPEVPYMVATASHGTQRFLLPEDFRQMNWPKEKLLDNQGRYYTALVAPGDWMHVYVGGEEWAHPASGLNNYEYDIDDPDNTKYYTFNHATGELIFGNGNRTTALTDTDSVAVYFEPERIAPSNQINNHVAKLGFATSNNKDSVVIERLDLPQQYAEVLAKQATEIKLAQGHITDQGVTNLSVTLSGLGFTTQKTYFNGSSELVDDADWSIDVDNGIIYTATPTDPIAQTTIHYEYQPIYTLKKEDWDWVKTEGPLRQSISIKDSGWKTQVKTVELAIEADIQVIYLPDLCVVPGSIQFTLTGADSINDPFLKETNFINGTTELAVNSIKRSIERIPTLIPGGSNIAQFNLNFPINTSHTISFSSTEYFQTAKGSFGAVSGVGDYFVDGAALPQPIVYVKLASADSITPLNETITYWYNNPDTDSSGLYSVDYVNGVLYLQRPILDNSWTLMVQYHYTNFRVSYRIARVLDTTDYIVDIPNSRITITEREVVKHLLTPRPEIDVIPPYYLVNYDYVSDSREDILELKQHFTPIVKDYLLKILTKGNLF